MRARMMAEIFRIDCFSHEIISKNMRDYSSSAPEPATMFRHPAAPKRAGRRSDFRLTGQDFREGIVHIEGWLIADLGVDHTLVQIGGNLVSFAAKRGGVGADFAAVEVNGGDGLQVAAVADLVAFGVELVADTAAGDHRFTGAQLHHVAEDGGQLLPPGVQAHLAVEVHIHGFLGLPDGPTQPFPLTQQEHQQHRNVGDLVGVNGIGGFHSRLVNGIGIDLVQQGGLLHFDHIPVPAQDFLGFRHQPLQLILIAERFLQIHSITPLLFVE